jgi:hypothetical protein
VSLRLGSGAERPQPLVLAFPYLALTPADASSAGLYGNDKYRYAQRSKYEKWCSHGVTAAAFWVLARSAEAISAPSIFVAQSMSEYRAKVELLILIKFISNPLLRVAHVAEANRARPSQREYCAFQDH